MEDNTSTCPVCNKPADKLCSACRAVSYCSAEHQKQHWKKEHKHACKVWTVKVSEVMGRFVVAARDIPAGTIIMNEEALAIGPKQCTIPLCLACYRKVTGAYACSQCHFPMCSVECEKMPIHADNECLTFRKKRALPKSIDLNSHHPVYESILALRCLRLKEVNPKKWAKLCTMEHHNSLREQNEGLWNRNEINVVQYLINMYGFKEEPATIHTVLGYSDINSFEIQTKNRVSICGLFPDISLMAHECISNTHHSVTDNLRMVVRNTVPIKKGEMITTTYTHTLEGTIERREHVKASKLFDCCCLRCKDPTEFGTFFSAVKCKNCVDGYLLPVYPLNYKPIWACNACDLTAPNKSIEMIIEGIKEEIEEAESVQSVIELLEVILQKYSGKVIHQNHFLMIGIHHTLSQYYGQIKGWSMPDLSLDSLRRKEEICRKLLTVLDVLEPGLSRIRGATVFELQQAIYFRIQKEFSDGLISVTDLKHSLLEVMDMLRFAHKVLNFDSPTSQSGRIAVTIPESMGVVKTVLRKVCDVEIDDDGDGL